MKMYKIIPIQHKVEELTYDGTYEQQRTRLHYVFLDHAKMTKEGDYIFVNDTGLLDGTEQREGSFYWFCDNGEYRQFIGAALYWGTHRENNADPHLTIDQVRERIFWARPAGAVPANKELEVESFDNLEDLFKSLEY